MKKCLEITFWILTDALLIFGISFLPSIFSIFCFITAVIIVPIKEWQSILKKIFIKPVYSAIIAICIAFLIAEFPIARVVSGIDKLINPEPVSSDFKTYYEEPEEAQNQNHTDSKSSTLTSSNPSANTTNSSSKTVSSSGSNTTVDVDKNTQKESGTTVNTNHPPKTSSNKTINDGYYRTPSGERYHRSPTCGGKNSYEITFDETIEAGLTPCQKCAK